ncbi:MAG: hypothetical protein U5S82_23945 [Gammaproteobacteria bacterium]|nr:hypothetical protein [Gammaproteobacteria bacterium]
MKIFDWLKSGLVAIGRASEFFTLRDFYVGLPLPARVIFWVPTLIFMMLLTEVVGDIIPVLIFLAVFIHFNRYLLRQLRQK